MQHTIEVKTGLNGGSPAWGTITVDTNAWIPVRFESKRNTQCHFSLTKENLDNFLAAFEEARKLAYPPKPVRPTILPSHITKGITVKNDRGDVRTLIVLNFAGLRRYGLLSEKSQVVFETFESAAQAAQYLNLNEYTIA